MEDKIEICGRELRFVMQPGVFAKHGLDYGSKLLLDVLLETWLVSRSPRRSDSTEELNVSHLRDGLTPELILDLGCGCGVLGISLASCFPEAKVYMVDADIRAVRNSRLNAKLNGVKNVEVGIGDWTDNLPEGLKFDLIVSNPPTHQGWEVLEKFIEGAHLVLKTKGELWMVMSRMTSVIKQLEENFRQVEIVKNKKGYMIVRSLKH